jgi:hypothetical protein
LELLEDRGVYQIQGIADANKDGRQQLMQLPSGDAARTPPYRVGRK